nr:MAG TPA: hypothetical protein [Caudoviricetes sp.]
MIKRIFFTFIVLQIFFIGPCYASSDRLADIGAELFKERIVEDIPFEVTDFKIANEASVAREQPHMACDSKYEFMAVQNQNVMLMIDVYVNREGYIDSIIICGPSVEKRNSKFLTLVLAESMKAIGLNMDEIMWLCSKGSISGNTYEGSVFSTGMGRTVYYSMSLTSDGFGINRIDRMSLTDRFTRSMLAN